MMARARILHMLVPGENVSPFDVNMAADAGFDVIVPYRGVGAKKVTGLVQDAIFSRPPKRYNETGVFIGGYDVNVAADMLEQARKAMVPPFEVAVFADPNGAYTTSAALVALVEHHLREKTGAGFQDRDIEIFGAGPVALCTAVLVAQQGGRPRLVRHSPLSSEKAAALETFCQRYDVELPCIAAVEDNEKSAAIESAHVVVTAAKAGVQILSEALLKKTRHLVVAADVNAVPPVGIEGIEPTDNGVELATAGKTALGIGALAIGNIKYKTQQGLFKVMQEADKAVVLDFPDAYAFAVKQVG